MGKISRAAWLTFLLIGSISFAGVGILSLYAGICLVPDVGATAFRSKNPIEWLIQTILTFIASIFIFYLFYNLKCKKNNK